MGKHYPAATHANANPNFHADAELVLFSIANIDPVTFARHIDNSISNTFSDVCIFHSNPQRERNSW